LVDEVLAVGDIRFQKKCLGKMGDVARAGRTVILVSHQLNQIRRLCNRVLWLDAGAIRREGPTAVTVSSYEEDMSATRDDERAVAGVAQFLRWHLSGENRLEDHILPNEGELSLNFVVRVNQPIHSAHHGIGLYDQDRHLLWGNAADGITLGPGLHEFRYKLPAMPLRPGAYSWRVTLWDGLTRIDDWECTPSMQVVTLPVTHYRDEWAGFLNIPSELTIVEVDRRSTP